MNKRLIARLMQKRVLGIKYSGVYFFRGAYEHILRGIAFDYVPRGVYIENFRFPLFDFGGPNLAYSERLAERSFIGKGEMSEEAIVEYVMASPEGKDAFENQEPMQLSAFVKYLVESDALLNPHAKLIHAAALILLDETRQAEAMLEFMPSDLHPKDVSRWDLLRQSLQKGEGTARMLLEQVRQENIRAFGLS